MLVFNGSLTTKEKKIQFFFCPLVGQLPDPAGAGGEEGPQGAPHPRALQRGADIGEAPAHRDLPGHHVLHQQRGQAGLLHDPGQDWLLEERFWMS